MQQNKIFKRTFSLITILLAILMVCGVYTLGQVPVADPKENVSSDDSKEIEYQKLEVERQKLQLEKLKAWLIAGSTFFPLVLGIIAIYSQVRTAFKLKEAEAKTAFELKAAEIILNSDNPFSAHAKAEALSKLFPNRIPKTSPILLIQKSYPALGLKK